MAEKREAKRLEKAAARTKKARKSES
jgi:hypothetical protein